jgi:predicted esterase
MHGRNGGLMRPLVKGALAMFCVAWPLGARAATIEMKDGRTLVGKVAPAASVADEESTTQDQIRPIVMLDDGLRRLFVPRREIQQLREADSGERTERFEIHQAVPEAGNRIASVGPIIRMEPWDDFGRRILTMNSTQGPLDIIQGITEITPVWTSVRSLKRFLWEQRIATSSIPRETLSRILRKATDPKDLEQRLSVVRLYLQAERYQDARAELDQILKDFPEQQAQFAPTVQTLRQLSARRLLAEVQVRADAGQHQLAYAMLEKFPAEGVAGETLQEVREKLEAYKSLTDQGREVLDKLKAHYDEITDSALKGRLEPVLTEIARELNVHTLPRMTAYRQLWEDEQLLPNEKLSLAISGWLVGANDAHRNLSVALSTYDVRGQVRQYLIKPGKLDREQILESLKAQEGATPETVAALMAHMKPPLETPESHTPGFYELEVPGLAGEPAVNYLVQLPPEYDPYRRYPAVVTLHGAGTTPQHQVDWWAGQRGDDGVPAGQAARHGYIVIAPAWAKEHQKTYEYSDREHAAVLNSLRDACRRFSIDTDRVFLSGHSMGGNAAWDIGLAHPDLWAGLNPIVASSGKFVARYWKNGRRLPMYFVAGELDGDRMVKNAQELDRYFRYNGFNVTVAEFRGRGHEHFSDEVLALFDWMGRHRREFFPKKFECASMRPGDNFFWWVEVENMPAKAMVDPASWPPPAGTKEALISGSINANNTLSVKAGAGAVSVWLAPEIIDFKEKAQVTLNGKKLGDGPFIEPDLTVLLEDVRTRGDRQHPFWARL